MVFRNRTERTPSGLYLALECPFVETSDFKRKAICVPPLAFGQNEIKHQQDSRNDGKKENDQGVGCFYPSGREASR